MSEIMQRIPRDAQFWRANKAAKERPPTMADIDEGAQIQRQLREDIERYFEKRAGKVQEQPPKESFFGLLIAIAGAILADAVKDDQAAK